MPQNDGLIAPYASSLSTTLTTPQTVAGLIVAQSGVSTQAVAGGYLAQSISPETLSATAVSLTTAYGYLTRVVVPVSGTSTYLDVIFTAYGSPSNAIWGLYTGTGVAPIAYTAESHSSITGNGLTSIPWVTPVALTPGTYYVYQCYTATSPSMPGVTATATGSVGAAILNPNVALASGTLNTAVLASGAPTTISASTALTFGTGWALNSFKVWYGIR
jgi:hypothetical protein